MKIIERIETNCSGSVVSNNVVQKLQSVYKQVDRVGAQAINASDPKDYFWDIKATVTIEKANDIWLVTVDHEVKMMAVWLLIYSAFAFYELVAGKFIFFLFVLSFLLVVPIALARWRGEKISKALSKTKSEISLKNI